MEKKTLTREEKIRMLIDSDMDMNETVQTMSETVEALLRHGCQGYANMTDQDLEDEYIDRFGDQE